MYVRVWVVEQLSKIGLNTYKGCYQLHKQASFGERREVRKQDSGLRRNGQQNATDRGARDRFRGTDSLPNMMVRGTESPRRRARMA